MGRSGSGKGTQINLLKESYNKENTESSIFHYEAGNIFREIIKSGNYSSNLIKKITEEGGLVPDFITDSLFISRMVDQFQGDNQLIIFDGYPRSFIQADSLDKTLQYFGRSHAVVLHIKVSEEEVRTRMAERGRYDDKDSAVLENRIKFYNESVLPTLERYRTNSRYTVIDIDGEGDVNDIHKDIMTKLTAIK